MKIIKFYLNTFKALIENMTNEIKIVSEKSNDIQNVHF